MGVAESFKILFKQEAFELVNSRSSIFFAMNFDCSMYSIAID
jgi:hypothetical protein